MRRRLRKPQKLAMPYLHRTQHPALLKKMRLGKTLSTIRRCEMYVPINRGTGQRFLVVAPNSALGSWEKELKLEGYEGDYVYLRGIASKRFDLMQQNYTWNLINKEGWRALPEIADEQWDAVILDESHFIKNPKAKVTKFFLNNFRDVPHKWILTGTVNPQGWLDVWNQIAFLDGTAFNCANYWTFRSRYFEKLLFGYDWDPKIGAETMIKNELADRAFVLSREDVDMEVEKIYEERYLELPAKLQKVYKGVEENMLLEYKEKEISTKYAPVKFTMLRHLCNGFIDGELVWPGKFLELMSLLTGELAHEQVVVWFSYNEEIVAARQFIDKYNDKGVNANNQIKYRWADGSVNVPTRIKYEHEFDAGKFRVLLMQSAIGREGMNLSASSVAIYFNVPYGRLAREQTEDRILDIEKEGSLLIIDLCVKDSVDTAMLESVQDKIFKHNWSLKRVFKIMNKHMEERAA